MSSVPWWRIGLRASTGPRWMQRWNAGRPLVAAMSAEKHRVQLLLHEESVGIKNEAAEMQSEKQADEPFCDTLVNFWGFKGQAENFRATRQSGRKPNPTLPEVRRSSRGTPLP